MDSVDQTSAETTTFEPKVIVVGAHKTGTTSLATAMSSLGYRVAGFIIPGLDPESLRGLAPATARASVVDAASSMLQEFDCAEDTPWWEIYPELDERFPGSRFILTIRDADRWLESVVQHFGNENVALHEWIYGEGVAAQHADRYRAHYLRHNEAVRAYFADRPDDLLVLDLQTGDGWPELCQFLGEPVPPYEFPHANARADRGNSVSRITRRIGRVIEMKRHGTTAFSRALELQMAAPVVARSVRLALADEQVANDEVVAADIRSLIDAQTPEIAALKASLGVGYVARSADSLEELWSIFQFELLHLFSSIDESAIDRSTSSGRVEDEARRILDAVQRCAQTVESR